MREAVRRRIALVVAVLAALFLVIFTIGFQVMLNESQVRSGPPGMDSQIANFMLMAGLYGVSFLGLALGVLVSADTLSGEIASGTIQTLVSKPLRRYQIVLGKWLGFAMLLGVFIAVLAGGMMAVVFVSSGYQVNNMLAGIGLIYLVSLTAMSATLALSSRLSTLATGGTVFGLYGISLVGGWVEQIGSILNNQTAIDIGVVISLLFPCEAVWRRAAFEMTSPLLRNLGASPFASNSTPSEVMVVYAGLYLLAAVVLAARGFGKRDL